MEPALIHCVSLANENVCRHFVFGAPKFSERGKKNEIIERLDWQRQAECSRLRAVFRSRHKYILTVTTQLLWHYNPCRANRIVEPLIRRGFSLDDQAVLRAAGSLSGPNRTGLWHRSVWRVRSPKARMRLGATGAGTCQRHRFARSAWGPTFDHNAACAWVRPRP